MKYFLFYLVLINIFSGILFVVDKFNSGRKHVKRVSEFNLHIMELMGGVFIIFPLMHIIRHKNRKTKYNFITGVILLIWMVFFYKIIGYFYPEFTF